MGHLLKVTDIQKSYKRRQAVKSLSLELCEGEVVGMLGPNGAGKTTAFYMIAGLIKPDNGTIEVDGTDISTWPISRRAESGLGYLPQEPSIFKKVSVEDNIRIALESLGYKQKEKLESKLQEVLDELRLNKVRAQLGNTLSGGERRRTEIGRLLAIEPTFLLMDEPFSGIDPISINELQKLIRQFKSRGFGLLISDHNVQATLKICDRAYIVHHGQVIAQGAPEEILADKTVREVYLGDQFEI